MEHVPDPNSPHVPIIRPPTIGAIRSGIAPRVRQCTANLPEDTKGRVIVRFQAVAAGGKVSAADISVEAIGFEDPDVVACVKGGFAELKVDAGEGQPDGDQKVTMPFTVPILR